MISIVGLGPGSKDALTIGAVKALKESSHVYLRTTKHPVVPYIKSLGVNFFSYDDKYEKADTFDEVYSEIANDLIKEYKKYNDIVYAVPGHPLESEESVSLLIDICEKENIDFRIISGVSFIDALAQALHIDPARKMKVADAFDIRKTVFDRRNALVITQIYDKLIASEVKLALEEYYGSETLIYFVHAPGIENMQNIRKIPLYELDRQNDIDHMTYVYIPPVKNDIKDFYDLTDIMNKLRGADGCPWDKEQTHETLKKYLIEECYEVIEAIDEMDTDKLVEELGDVLFQVIFHAQIGKEEEYFNINDVIQKICDKMIERHPNVFGELKVETSDDVLKMWNEIKKQEQNLKTHTDELKHVAKCLPALMRAEKVQSVASKAGFDFKNVECAMDKVPEELNEVKDVYKGNDREIISEEVGDLLFAGVNVSRLLDIDPEFALHYTIDKFIKRFEFIEKSVQKEGLKFEEIKSEEADYLWEKAKDNQRTDLSKNVAKKKDFSSQ